MQINMSEINNSDQEWYCDAIYQGGLYIITAILEAIAILTLIILTWIIKNYIQCN